MRNSLYSVTIEEALMQIEGTNSYQKRLLVLALVLWLILLSTYKYFELLLSEEVLMIYQLGMLVGSPCISLLSNYIGRKLSTILCSVLLGLLLLLSIFTEDSSYLPLFLIGGLIAGSMVTSFLMMIEVVQSQHRSLYTNVLFSAFGLSLTIGTALYISLDRTIVLGVTSVLVCIVGILFVFLQESPRYLAAVKGKYALARIALNLISSTNKKSSFEDILEGEKVIGNAEECSENTPTMTRRNGKHSFVQISDSVVSVTTAELSAVKKYNIFNIWFCLQTRKSLSVLIILGFLVSLTRSINESAHRISWRYESIILGLLITALIIPINYLIRRTTRNFALMILLGISTLFSIVALLLGAKTCDDNDACIATKIALNSTLSISNVSLLGSLIIVYILSVESLQTTVRSPGMFYIELFMKAGLLIGNIKYSDTIIYQLVIAIMMISSICFLSICCLDERADVTMDDYLNEDREEMNKPLEISHMNVSISNIDHNV